LYLGWTIHTQEGALPTPSISAEPGSVISWGQPVTIVCQGPAEADTFRLERVNGSPAFKDVNVAPQPGRSGTEARFSEDTAGHYRCIYRKKHDRWSDRSEYLKLVVT
ncbi:leukocyte-associated immunoglobulin-like receptor 2 isoform a precursor, partial [Daubentonia madagascariensis]